MIHKFKNQILLSMVLYGLFFIPGLSHAVTYTYDDFDRLTKVEYADGTAVEYAYDEVGNRLSENIVVPGDVSGSEVMAGSDETSSIGADTVSGAMKPGSASSTAGQSLNSALAGGGIPTVRLNPASTPPGRIGTKVAVRVLIEGVTDLGGFQFEINYNPAVVTVAAASDVSFGPFLASTGRSSSPIGPAIDNAAGKITYGGFTFGSLAGPSGNGILATISFTIKRKQTSGILNLANVTLMDSSANIITAGGAAQAAAGSGAQTASDTGGKADKKSGTAAIDQKPTSKTGSSGSVTSKNIYLNGLTETLALASYQNPSADLKWPFNSETTVEDIRNRFNAARENENAQLSTLLPPMMTLPSQQEWNSMSDGEKALWLINCERVDRGFAPLDRVNHAVTGISQEYAQYLLDHSSFSDTADGHNPWDRLSNNANVGSCYGWTGENLAAFMSEGDGWTLPIERSIYAWMYDDRAAGWDHRQTILSPLFEDDSGPSGKEGFLGIGHATGALPGYSNSDVIVMTVFDPCAAWDIPGGVHTDLTDAIIALQLLSGVDVSGEYISFDADRNGDGKIGLEEVIYILQKATGLR